MDLKNFAKALLMAQGMREDIAEKKSNKVLEIYETLEYKKSNLEAGQEEDGVLSGVVTIYCDGACRGNPGEAGSGVLVISDDVEAHYCGAYEEKGTNNTAELKAMIFALEKAQEAAAVKIYVDSQYVINAVTGWAYGWKKNDWKKKDGKPVKNVDLVKKAHELFVNLKSKRGIPVEVIYVKGHSGDKGNDLTDALANRAIDEKIVDFQKIEG